MIKRMLTTLVALVLMANAVAAFSPGTGDGEQCTDACCAAAHCDAAVQLLMAAQCCTINPQQDAEPNLPQSLPIAVQKQELKAASAIWPTQANSSCLKQIRFPSSPTRHLAGSTSRYLENNSFLI